MCDYSLMQYPNRIAKRGEELVTYRFPSGCIGLASPADFDNHPRGSIWRRLECALRGTDSCSVPAVCVPPSARLLVRELGSRLQREYGLGAEEVATFEQLTPESTWRDASRFEKGVYPAPAGTVSGPASPPPESGLRQLRFADGYISRI